MRDRIRLKHANDLWIETSLEEALGETGADRARRFEEWRERGVAFIILQADEDETPVLHFTEAVREAGFILRTVHPEAGFDSLKALRGEILREVKQGHGLILGSGALLETFLALLLVALKKKSMSPEDAVAFASQRRTFQPEDRIVYEFKQYLDPAYEIPAAARPAPESPSTPSSDAPEPRPAAEMIVESDSPAAPVAPPAPGPTQLEDEPVEESSEQIERVAPEPADPFGLNESSDRVPVETQPVTSPEEPPPANPEPEPVASDSDSDIEAIKASFAPAELTREEPESAPVTDEPAAVRPVAKEITPTPAPPAPAKVPPLPTATVAPAPVTEEGSFQASRYTIRVKLIAITSGIIIVALATMIFAASYFFRRAMVTAVQENNLNQATVIGSRVESELHGLEGNARLLVTGGGGGALREEFFRANPGIIYVGTATPNPDGLDIRRNIYNRPFLDANDIDEGDIARLHGLNGKTFLKSFNGATVFQNISPGFVIPVLGLSLPRVPGEEIILVYLDAEKFLEVFTGGDNADPETNITRTFMVNSLGEVIAHPDPARVLSRSNMADLEIVKALLESAVDSGQKAYQDESGKDFLGSYKKISFANLGVISTAEEDRVLQPVYWIQTNNILITVIVLVLAILIVYYVARSLSVPIVRLVGATRAVEQGDYSVGISPASRDEVGVLTDSFVRMARGLGEREKLKDAMVKFVNKQVADLALRGEIKLGGEQREKVAVFFSDLRGFTAMSEKMSAEEVVAYLNEYFTGMVSCINNTHGIVDKFIGDAVMAHWGAFESHGNDTENAINGALMMREAIIAFNERGGGNRPFAKQGCGINTGRLVSGQIGSEERFEFTVIGDTVNLASRIEALNKPFGTDILISQDSYEEVKDIYKFEPQPAIKVKGKSEPQVIYAVVGRLDDPNCPADMDEVRKLLGIEFDSSKAVDPDAKEEKFEVVG